MRKYRPSPSESILTLSEGLALATCVAVSGLMRLATVHPLSQVDVYHGNTKKGVYYNLYYTLGGKMKRMKKAFSPQGPVIRGFAMGWKKI